MQGTDLLKGVTEMILLDLEVVTNLEIEPEPVAGTEVSRQAKRGVGADPTGAMDDLIDATRRYADLDGEMMLCGAEGLKELLQQHLAGVHWADGRHDVHLLARSGQSYPPPPT